MHQSSFIRYPAGCRQQCISLDQIDLHPGWIEPRGFRIGQDRISSQKAPQPVDGAVDGITGAVGVALAITRKLTEFGIGKGCFEHRIGDHQPQNDAQSRSPHFCRLLAQPACLDRFEHGDHDRRSRQSRSALGTKLHFELGYTSAPL